MINFYRTISLFFISSVLWQPSLWKWLLNVLKVQWLRFFLYFPGRIQQYLWTMLYSFTTLVIGNKHQNSFHNLNNAWKWLNKGNRMLIKRLETFKIQCIQMYFIHNFFVLILSTLDSSLSIGFRLISMYSLVGKLFVLLFFI